MSNFIESKHYPQTYTELLCIPTDCYEIFVDFIMQVTGEAIEEVSTSACVDNVLMNSSQLRFCNISSDRANLESIVSGYFAQQSCIIRSLHNPSSTLLCDYVDNSGLEATSHILGDSTLLQALDAFALVLSQRLGYEIGFAYVSIQKRNQDWIASYRAGVSPLECGRYYIHPSWHLPKNGKENIIIDPALAFGSGHHASTFMCIALLSTMDLAGKNCLDVGCGSGILGIVMAKQGGVVDVCDVDTLAIEETAKNFTRNNVATNAMWCGSIDNIGAFAEALDSSRLDSNHKVYHSSDCTDHRIFYDVVCANIVADVLVCMRTDFIKVLKPGGILILSGILEEKCKWVLENFSDMQLLQKEQKDEWVSLKFASQT